MIMKRVYLFVLFIAVCTFTGCGLKISEKENEKLSRIEICDADGSSIAVLEDQSSSDVKSFFEDEMWVSEEQPDETLTPQYTIYLYQEKTRTLLQEEDTERYEKIVTCVTYENSDVVKYVINVDTVPGIVSEEDLTFYFTGTKAFFSEIEKICSV